MCWCHWHRYVTFWAIWSNGSLGRLDYMLFGWKSILYPCVINVWSHFCYKFFNVHLIDWSVLPIFLCVNAHTKGWWEDSHPIKAILNSITMSSIPSYSITGRLFNTALWCSKKSFHELVRKMKLCSLGCYLFTAWHHIFLAEVGGTVRRLSYRKIGVGDRKEGVMRSWALRVGDRDGEGERRRIWKAE